MDDHLRYKFGTTKREKNGTLFPKRHQIKHLEFVRSWFGTMGSKVQISNFSPGQVSKSGLRNGVGRIRQQCPFWAKDAKAGYKMINARAETIAEKPAFRESLLSRRCLFPPTAFMNGRNTAREGLPFALLSRTIRSLRSLESGTDGRTRNGNSSKPVRSLRLQQMHFCPTFMTECRSSSRVKTMIDGLIRDSKQHAKLAKG